MFSSCFTVPEPREEPHHETTATLLLGCKTTVSIGDYFFTSAKSADMTPTCSLRIDGNNGNMIGRALFTTTRQTLCDVTTYLGDTLIFYKTEGDIQRVRFESFSTEDIMKGLLICVSMKNAPTRVYHVVFK